jgi:phosphoserine phosphatase
LAAVDPARFMSAQQLVERLEARRDTAAVIAFDADGTLWSGDVGEDAFLRAVAEGLLLDDALPALQQAAASHGLPVSNSPNALARALYVAYTEGRFPEREICEVMTWCYAGWPLTRFAAYAARVVEEAGLRDRLRPQVAEVVRHARSLQLETLVVSASPRTLVERGAALLGFGPEHVIAATPRYRDERIAAEMDGPIPYGPTKCELAYRVIGKRSWLASFGDNVFDIDMLSAAEIGVAVEPKPALAERLPALPQIMVLRRSDP